MVLVAVVPVAVELIVELVGYLTSYPLTSV
jgi:hypothetical protein